MIGWLGDQQMLSYKIGVGYNNLKYIISLKKNPNYTYKIGVGYNNHADPTIIDHIFVGLCLRT